MNNILGRHTGIRADTQGIGADTRVCPYGNALNITTVRAHPSVCKKKGKH